MGITWLGASSVLLLIAVLLFIALPRFYKRPTVSMIHAEKSADDILAPESDQQEDFSVASSTTSFPEAELEAEESTSDLKRGRLAVFSLGAASLLLALIFIPLAVFTSVSWLWVLGFFLVSALTLGTLRYLAVTEAKKRGQLYRAEQAGEKGESEIILAKPGIQASQVEKKLHTSQRDFSPVELSVKPATKPIRTPAQTPISYAAKSLRYARTHASVARPSLVGTAGAVELKDKKVLDPQFTAEQGWEVTEVPAPIYLEVEEAKLSLPAPIEIPAYQKSESKSLAEAQQLGIEAKPNTLDEILKRRRA